MALSVGDRRVRPLTADEVLRMVDAGILGEDERVELLQGVLTAVSPKSPAHSEVETRLVRWLAAAVTGGSYDLRIEQPLVVPDRTSLPEPDIAVVDRDRPVGRHPATALLVVEVAVTSVTTVTTIKPALYAAAGIPELWVVDVPHRQVRIFTDPASDAYRTSTIADAGATVTPRAVDVQPLAIGSLFAGL